ncbi:MAG: hypothetical protein WBX01_05285 [Nitrososphaeraceae archaeon]|jgi:hypothetical protein
MKGKILLFGILFLIFMSSTTLNLYSTPQKNLEINHVYNYVDENKIMHVLGEMKNIGSKAMTNVTIGATFFDPEGKIINEYKRSAELRTINPGFVSPFEILFIDQKTVDKVKDFKLFVNGTEAGPQPEDLQINVDSSRQDILGFYYINGVIFNSGKASANNSIAIATLYDTDGKVVAIGRGLAEPKDIPSNSGASFGLAIIDKLQTQKGRSYSVVADSDAYVSNTTIAKEK